MNVDDTVTVPVKLGVHVADAVNVDDGDVDGVAAWLLAKEAETLEVLVREEVLVNDADAVKLAVTETAAVREAVTVALPVTLLVLVNEPVRDPSANETSHNSKKSIAATTCRGNIATT